MPEGVVQASLPRRALAYVIDLLILALPLGAGSALLASHGFDQAIKPGIAGLCTLALISGVYSASVCTTLARSGQSLGKKLLGLRVLSADTGRSAPLNATHTPQQRLCRWTAADRGWTSDHRSTARQKIRRRADLAT